MIDIRLRRTGRTTRMIEQAIRLAIADGRAVYVLAATYREARMMDQECDRMFERLGVERPRIGGFIKFETEQSLTPFDWVSLRTPGMHPNCIVLVDHHAIETKFARMLDQLHRYDQKGTA